MWPIRPLLAPVLVLFLALAGFVAPALAEPTFPKLTGRVVDGANIIPADVEARLTQKLEALEKNSRRQLVVVTIPDLEGYEISDFGYRLGRVWGLGDKQRNDGALLIVAPNQRKVRIEVGYGLEGILTDGLSFLIIEKTIIPRFKAGDVPGGIEAGSDALIRQLTLPESEARAQAKAADQAAERSRGGSEVGPAALFPLLIFGIWALMAFGGHGHGRRHRHGSGLPMVLLGPGMGGHRGGGFGGGFRGGGGSFGGGGASGGW
ncbi:TPM domain-containing protein [Sphingopyxis chilensis]